MKAFSKSIRNLSRGLRPSKRMPRDSDFLTTCNGMVGRDGVLQSIDELTRMATGVITDAFPYPQLFLFSEVIIVCGQTKIYEWVAGALVLKLTVTAGNTWRAADFHNYIYMSNGKVAVERDPTSLEYAVSTQPFFSSIVNFNGQVMIGAPNVEI